MCASEYHLYRSKQHDAQYEGNGSFDNQAHFLCSSAQRVIWRYYASNSGLKLFSLRGYDTSGMGIKAIASIGAVFAIVVGCAVFRVNIWTLLPWYPAPPRRCGDGTEQLGIAQQAVDKPNKER